MLSESWSKSSYSAYNGSCVEASFRKSSHSNSNGCVEMALRKSSHSTSNGQCVEVGDGCGLVHVRDSKDPQSPVLNFTPAAWMSFLAGLKGA